MSQKNTTSNVPNITYFRPGQLVFHVNENMHDGDERREKIRSLIDWANKLAKSQKIGIELSASSKKVFSFKAVGIPDLPSSVSVQQIAPPIDARVAYKSPQVKPQSPFSLVFADAKSEKWPEFPTKPKEQEDALEELLELVILLDDNRKDAPGNLEVVSPNWLMSGSPSSPGSTGGPGIRPTPYDGSANTEEYKFSLLPKIRNESVGGRLGEPDVNVVVAILDTAPKLKDVKEDEVLESIYNKWVKSARSGYEHSLIKTLLGKGGKLKKVYFDNDVDTPIQGVEENGYIQVEDHDYEMTDHGLFVAGIIHTIAPQAELHLFQVLNRYGVGDLSSIAQALQQIQDDDEKFPKNRLLVNLSLTINIPLEKAHGKNDKMLDKILDYIGNTKDGADHRAARTIDRICNSFYAQGAKVIAAAGNNGEEGNRPQACYPAAFESVLGVGALPKDKKPADASSKVKTTSYSNRSDRPERTGITTFGGDEQENKGDKKGILGIYLEEFPKSNNCPDPTLSSNGWGWWGGTSFATPIITGMTAAVRGFIPGLNTMEDAVATLFETQRYKTEDFNEDVLYVTQGTQAP